MLIFLRLRTTSCDDIEGTGEEQLMVVVDNDCNNVNGLENDNKVSVTGSTQVCSFH